MDNNLKIYTMHCGRYGVIMVVSTSKERARELMEQYENYNPKKEISEVEIVSGLVIVDYGDM